MTYFKHSVYLTKNQLRKLSAASGKGEPVSLRIDPTVRGNSDLYLTKSQINKLSDGKVHDITLSKTQLSKNGGLLVTIPMILAGISAAASIAGAASGVAKTVNQKKHESRVESESKRHNARVENLLAAKEGKGVFLPKKIGRGVYLPKKMS